MPHVVAEIIRNAERLLSDAKILAAAQRYQSAVSLAILSLEESGKACLVRWKRSGFLKRDISNDIRAGHVPKQRILGAYLFTKAAFEAVFFDEKGNPVEPDDSAETIEKGAKAGYESGARMIYYAESGALDFMKMAGFYTDLNDRLEVMSRGGDLSETDAARHIKDAELALEMVAASERLQRGTAAVYEERRTEKQKRISREDHEQIWEAISKPES